MATESDWRLLARQAINAAYFEGRAKGLEGRALEKYARANGYPFGLRENTPYKLWLDEARKIFGGLTQRRLATDAVALLADRRSLVPATVPFRLTKLWPEHSAARMRWLGRVVLGDWAAIWYGKGELAAAVGDRELDSRRGRPCFREQIGDDDSMTCSLQEAAGILEAAGLFDFSAIDLAACEGEPVAQGNTNA